MDVFPIPQLSDNYAYLIVDPGSRQAGVVDCAEAEPVLEQVARRGVTLVAVLATHHHFDHVGGNRDLLARCPDLRIYGSGDDAPVIFIPAHTSGHVAYWFPEHRSVFTGDTLFAGGCGRLFEGDAAQMMASLGKLAGLPGDTRVYCGHEYTEKNLEFALTLEPGNDALRAKMAAVRALRRAGRPTVPSTIADEKATNPFLRTDSPELAAAVRTRVPDVGADAVALFAAVRGLKDRF
jgi:hydroxyacylglutathione hydrolase